MSRMSTTESRPAIGATNLAGRYRLETHVASGKHSEVWRATDLVMNRTVAVKLGRADDTEAAVRFKREAGVLTRLIHPNLLQLFAAGETEDGRPFMVLEWVEGPSLSSLMTEVGRFSWTDAALVGRAVARALVVAHEHDVLHRDIKPSNILIPGGLLADAKLADFSVLGELDQEDATLGRLTMAGVVVGTPLYMAPEQLSGKSLSNRTDLYALALVLRNMLWGEPTNVHTFKLVAERVTSTAELPAHPLMPAEFRDLLATMMRRDPEARPASARDVASALDGLLATFANRPPAAAARPPVLAQVPIEAVETTIVARTTAVYRASLPAQSSKSRLAMTAAAALAVIVLATFLMTARATVGSSVRPVGGAPIPMAIVQAVGLMVAGLLLGFLVARVIEYRRSDLEREVNLALTGSRDRANLSRTMVLAVDAIIQQTSKLDARFLGATLIGMVHEYDTAKESSDKQQALVRATELLEKLLEKTSPWYVRNSKWVVAAASLVGLASGAVKLVGEVGGLIR
jgi:serine/threonine-protein kinase